VREDQIVDLAGEDAVGERLDEVAERFRHVGDLRAAAENPIDARPQQVVTAALALERSCSRPPIAAGGARGTRGSCAASRRARLPDARSWGDA
jgi:hypothetical protein